MNVGGALEHIIFFTFNDIHRFRSRRLHHLREAEMAALNVERLRSLLIDDLLSTNHKQSDCTDYAEASMPTKALSQRRK